MNFVYTAKNQQGEIIKGSIESEDEKTAVHEIKKRDMFIINIKKSGGLNLKLNFGGNKINLKDKIIFTKQLYIMIRAGLPIVDALESLGGEASNKALRDTIRDLIKKIKGGDSLSAAMAAHENAFSEIYVNMVKSGEKSGKVDDVLERLCSQLEKDYDLTRKIKGALSYPIFILFAMTVVICLVIILIIPQLKTIFEDAGVELPLMTRLLISLSGFLQKSWWMILISLIALAFGLIRLKKSESGKVYLDKFVLKIPVFSNLLRKSYVARFARTFSALLSSGLPLIEVFRSAAKVIGNSIYEKEIYEMSKKIEVGESVSAVFKKSKLFPGIVGQLALVGERSGNVDEIFDDIADFFDKEIDSITANLSTMLEPILMVIIGVGIGLVIVSVLQPIYGLVNAI